MRWAKLEKLEFLIFKLYYKATGIKAVWYSCVNRHIDQWTEEKAQKQTDIYGVK